MQVLGPMPSEEGLKGRGKAGRSYWSTFRGPGRGALRLREAGHSCSVLVMHWLLAKSQPHWAVLVSISSSSFLNTGSVPLCSLHPSRALPHTRDTGHPDRTEPQFPASNKLWPDGISLERREKPGVGWPFSLPQKPREGRPPAWVHTAAD